MSTLLFVNPKLLKLFKKSINKTLYSLSLFLSVTFYLCANNIFAINIPNGVITKKTISKYLSKNPVIVEAGAHNGTDTLEMAKLWPNSTIHAFEPVPELFQKIKNKIKHYSNIKIYNLALSDLIGKTKMYVSSRNDAASSLLPTNSVVFNHYQPKVLFNKEIYIESTTLDKWATVNNIKNIDFLWLDMQGYEPKMLMASPNILKTVKVIYTEVNHKELYAGSILFNEYRKFLETQGFQLVQVCFPFEDWGDALFVRKNLALVK
ncbi:MAG: FkbM family methyltransferase [Candidatus Babeliales bacterium]|nr:FkbM family methyltransferase [Candidatus Babeliales bacterium]